MRVAGVARLLKALHAEPAKGVRRGRDSGRSRRIEESGSPDL
jgi:hypothetical protein